MTFKQVIESAVSDKLFPANVAKDIFRNIERPKYKPEEKRPLTLAERDAVFKADFTLSDKTFVFILYGCGLRRGEALALTIFDINLKSRELTVNKAHKFVNDKPQQKPPKISIKRIAALLGDTEKMVMEVYNHILLEKEDAAGAVNAAMNI